MATNILQIAVTDDFDNDATSLSHYKENDEDYGLKIGKKSRIFYELYKNPAPLYRPGSKELTCPLQEFQAKANAERLRDWTLIVDDKLQLQNDVEESNGFNFYRSAHNLKRDRNDNGGIIDDSFQLIYANVFHRARRNDLVKAMKWYRWARNEWAHRNYIYALACIEEYYAAMIFLVGPKVLNLPDIETLLREDLRRNALAEIPIDQVDWYGPPF